MVIAVLLSAVGDYATENNTALYYSAGSSPMTILGSLAAATYQYFQGANKITSSNFTYQLVDGFARVGHASTATVQLSQRKSFVLQGQTYPHTVQWKYKSRLCYCLSIAMRLKRAIFFICCVGALFKSLIQGCTYWVQ